MAAGLSFTMDFKSATKGFFRPSAITDPMDRKRRQVLLKGGAFIRTRARSSIRRRKKSSAEGQAPSAHSKRSPNLRTILFSYDAAKDTVVVGPVLLNQVQLSAYDTGSMSVPQVLEGGGPVRVEQVSTNKGRNWRRRDLRRNRRQWEMRRTITKVYKPRPFMGPAMDAELTNILEELEGIL